MHEVSILLVEDNYGDALLMKAIMRKAKVANELVVATNAEMALDVLYRRNGYEEQQPIDVAFLDINLPGMNGIELLHAVKSDSDRASIPVVMLRSSDGPKDIQEAYEQEACGYLNKPVEIDELLALFQKLDEFWVTLVRQPNHG